MNYAYGVTIICLSENTGESVFLIVSVRAFSFPYSISTNRFGESPHLRPIFFHAHSFSSTHFTIKPKNQRSTKRRGREGRRGRRGEDTFDKVVWSDTRKYKVRHFVK